MYPVVSWPAPVRTALGVINRGMRKKYMAKFWKYLKAGVLIWGIVSLTIVLIFAAVIISSYMRNKEVVNVEQQQLQKTSGDIKLRVTRGANESSGIFIDISRGETPLVTNYQLPAKQYGLEAIDVTDATITRVKENEYRIILYSAVYDCDRASGQFIWLFKLKGRLNLVTMIDLSDLYKVGGKDSVMFGNKSIFLPSFGTSKSEQIVIPIEVQVGDVIKVTPMLNRRSIDMIRNNFGKEIDNRIAMLTNPDSTALLKQYKKAKDELNEVLTERTTAF